MERRKEEGREDGEKVGRRKREKGGHKWEEGRGKEGERKKGGGREGRGMREAKKKGRGIEQRHKAQSTHGDGKKDRGRERCTAKETQIKKETWKHGKILTRKKQIQMPETFEWTTGAQRMGKAGRMQLGRNSMEAGRGGINQSV